MDDQHREASSSCDASQQSKGLANRAKVGKFLTEAAGDAYNQRSKMTCFGAITPPSTNTRRVYGIWHI
jgi:hypothetical protein